MVAAEDHIRGAGVGADIVIAGLGHDTIDASDGDNIVFGDDGAITYQLTTGLRDRIESRYLNGSGNSPVRAVEAAVGDDVITTGIGSDVAIGGLGNETIDVSDGANIVIGDEGKIHYQNQLSDLEEISTHFTDGAGSFAQGGEHTITSGTGRDYILSGSGSDRLTSGDGADVILRDGQILFHPGTSIP